MHAAIETRLWSIKWGIAELVNHQEIQQKLRNEIDTVLGPGVQITEPDIHKLLYLQANNQGNSRAKDGHSSISPTNEPP